MDPICHLCCTQGTSGGSQNSCTEASQKWSRIPNTPCPQGPGLQGPRGSRGLHTGLQAALSLGHLCVSSLWGLLQCLALCTWRPCSHPFRPLPEATSLTLTSEPAALLPYSTAISQWLQLPCPTTSAWLLWASSKCQPGSSSPCPCSSAHIPEAASGPSIFLCGR